MPRPQTRVAFCQTLGELRSRIARAQKEHLRPQPHLKSLDHPRPLRPATPLQLQDGAAAYYCERAIAMLQRAEEAWDDDPDAAA